MRFHENALSMSLVLALALLAWRASFAAPSYSVTNPASGQRQRHSEPRVVEVDASDFACSMPDSIEGGRVAFRMPQHRARRSTTSHSVSSTRV